MKKIMQLTTLASLMLLTVTSQQVFATESGRFFLGADVGSTQFKGDGPGKNSVFAAGQEFKDSDSSYGIHAGFQFTNWFAVELGYTDFGSATDRFKIKPDIVFIVAPNDTQTVEAKGTSLAGVFAYSLDAGFSIFGVLGVIAMEYDTTFSGGFSEATGSLLEKDSFSDQGLLYGVGAKYALSQSFGLRADLRRNDVGDFSLDTASVGVEYSF
jgi:OOP family OmpA-OmpF porin